MPSSTSSFEAVARQIPRRHWPGLALAALGVGLLLVAAWEMHWRARGYSPSLDDDKALWAIQRERMLDNPRSTVLIGASRMLFNLDLGEWEKAFGTRPLQLATVSTNPSVYLDWIANHTDFAGTLVTGFAATMWMADAGAPIVIPTDNLKHAEDFTPAQRWSHWLGRPLDRHLAYIDHEDLTLKQLLKRLPIPDRAKVQPANPVPPRFMEADENRQGRMLEKVETDRAFREHIIGIWNFYFNPPPPPPGVTPEEHRARGMKRWEEVLAKTRADIAKIHARGGKVILVAFPSTGNVLSLERKFTPREIFWDRLVKESGADFAVHYEDHEGLRGFDCPEESHLNAKDATLFTRELARVLKEAGYGV